MSLQYEFSLRYPEFNSVEGCLLDVLMEDAQAEMSERRWGKLYERGVMALTAHLLKLRLDSQATQGGAILPLASESAGELSVSYAATVSNGSDDFYRTTAYGQEYLRLRKLIGIGVMVA